MRTIGHQIQAIIVALEEAKSQTKDIYLAYLDFKNAFGSIEPHTISHNGGHSPPTRHYKNLLATSTLKKLHHFEEPISQQQTPDPNQSWHYTRRCYEPILIQNVSRSTPQMARLEKDNLGYKFNTSTSITTTTTYASDLLTNALKNKTIIIQQRKMATCQRFLPKSNMCQKQRNKCERQGHCKCKRWVGGRNQRRWRAWSQSGDMAWTHMKGVGGQRDLMNMGLSIHAHKVIHHTF